jgi:hypothetical protein
MILLSLASLSRLAGGRPLDEAIVNDTMFSINSYEAVDRAKKTALAETVKTSMIGKNQYPDEDQVTSSQLICISWWKTNSVCKIYDGTIHSS